MEKILPQITRSKNVQKIVPFLKENRKTALSFIVFAIFVDIFFIITSSDVIIFGVLLTYAVFVKVFGIKSKSTFLLCLALLAAMFVNYISSGTSVATEKSTVWLVLFMAVGIFQQWRE